MRLPVAVLEILCSHSLAEFRPLPLLFARCIRHRRRSQTSPSSEGAKDAAVIESTSERRDVGIAPYGV